MLKGNIFITGGAGTLGRAIIQRATAENWPAKITVYSRDPLKHIRLRREFPQVRCILGDILDYEGLYKAMVGHDIVIHAAAQKHIPQAESDPINCYQTNVSGSLNVAAAAVQAGIKQALAISTDKAAYPMNTYGRSKAIMEDVWREYGRTWGDVCTFHLCRYGNVIGSNGSVVQVWQQQMAAGKRPTVTDLRMTRFWLSEAQAVNIVLKALSSPNGTNAIPMAPALDMQTFAQHVLGRDAELETIGLRPGERVHEWLITPEEYPFCYADGDGYWLLGETAVPGQGDEGYRSDKPLRFLNRDELLGILGVQS